MKRLNKKQKCTALLTLLPVIAVMGVIFYFSSQTAQTSTVTSSGFVDRLMEAITALFGEISASSYESVRHIATLIVRKSAHFLEFAALGFFLEIHFRTYLKHRTWLISGAISVLYALSDEIHQNFVSERAMRISDVCIDSLGAFCAIAAVCLLAYIFIKIKDRKGEHNEKV